MCKKLTVLFFIVLVMAGMIASQALGATSLFSDGFETSPVGASVPVGWTLPYSGIQHYVTDSTAAEGTQSYFLQGSPYHGTLLVKDLSPLNIEPGLLKVSFSMKVDMGLWTGSDGDNKVAYVLNKQVAAVGFRRVSGIDKILVYDGTSILLGLLDGINMADWNNFTLIWDTSNGTIKYLINNQFVFEGMAGPHYYEDTIELNTGNAGPGGGRPAAFFDNFTIEAYPQDIEVTPLAWDFGDVAWMGAPQSTFINIANTGGQDLTISGLSLVEPSGDFTVGTLESSVIASDASIDLEVSFAPTYLGYQEGTLQINSDDPEEPEVYVALSGVGVLSDTPCQQIEDVIQFIDDSVAAGELWGVGKGKSASNKVKALKHMLEAYCDLMLDGLISEACGQLSEIYKKLDGKDSPPDFVDGPARTTLQEVIGAMLSENCGDLDINDNCYTDGQCLSGECDVPVNKNHGECVEPLLPNGSICIANEECLSGFCNVPLGQTIGTCQ